jgi:hypothetical protein
MKMWPSHYSEQATGWTAVVPFPGGNIFLFAHSPNHLWGGGLSGRGVKLAIHLHLVPILRMHGAILPFPHTFYCVMPC